MHPGLTHSVPTLCSRATSLDVFTAQAAGLQEQHLAQLKFVYPEVLQLQRVRVARSSHERHGVELLIEMALEDSAAPPAPAAAAAAISGQGSGSANPVAAGLEVQRPAQNYTQPGQAAGSTGGRVADATPERRSTVTSGHAATPSKHQAASLKGKAFTAEMGAMRMEVERRLSNLVLQHYRGFLEAKGRPLQIPVDAATAGAAAAWDEDFDWERVPNVEAADLTPVQPSEVGPVNLCVQLPFFASH